MMTLYYAPGAVSLAVHIVLHELELKFDTVRLTTADDAHLTPEYLRVNPLGQLPALVLDDGQVLTQTPAILSFLAHRVPEARLWPEDPLAAARCQEMLSLIASSLHGAYTLLTRPDRLVPDAIAHEAMERAGRARVARFLQHIDARIGEPWALGEQYSVVDPYLAVMFAWSRHFRIDVPELRNLPGWFARVSSRPAFARTLRAEGLVDTEGRPTPPARV